MSLLLVRKTTSTETRVKNMRALVAELAMREMLFVDISVFLNFGKSGTRKYIQDLRAAGVMEIARYINGTDRHLGAPVYCITKNLDRIKVFEEGLTMPAKKRVGVGAPNILAMAQRDPTRIVHILHDDMPVALRMHRDLPIRHTDLMAAFFGLPGGAA